MEQMQSVSVPADKGSLVYMLRFFRHHGRGWVVFPVALLLATQWLVKYIVAPLVFGLLVLTLTPLLLTVELLLRRFYPITTRTSGTVTASAAPNAAIYGWAFPPNFTWKAPDPDTGELLTHRTNSRGWKDVEHELRKSPDKVRVLVIGDSETFGIVPNDQLYTRKLEQLFHNAGYDVEVISLGYGGWGTDQALVALEKEGIRYQPDIVISQFSSNDLTENLSLKGIHKHNKPFTAYILDDQLVIWREKDMTSPQEPLPQKEPREESQNIYPLY